MRARIRTTAITTAITTAAISVMLMGCVRAVHQSESGGDQVITEYDIAQIQAVSAYDAITKLHANFLSYRGETSLLGTSSPTPTVYLDGIRYGETQTLRNIPASEVAMIRLYRSWESAARFGSGNMGGVIEVKTKQ